MAVVAENALENQTLQMFSNWYAWLNRAGVPGYLGETNTPNADKPWSASEVSKWLTLLEKVYQSQDEAGATVAAVTAHCASVTVDGGGGLKVYGPDRGDVALDQRNFGVAFEQAAVAEAHPPTATSMRGLNLAAGAMDGNANFGPNSPGTYGTHYCYPDAPDLQYLKGRGFNLVRMPFKWERVQVRSASSPNADPSLKSSEVTRLKSAMTAAAQVGMKVIPSVQNYGGYIFSTSVFGTPNEGKIGSSKLSIAAYAAFCKRLASALKGYPGYGGLDIMNEPWSMPGTSPAKTWEQASQAACEKIAEVDTATRIWVSGYHLGKNGSHAASAPGQYNGLYSFIAHHPNPWIVSAANFGYTTHCYFGPGAGYNRTYDEAVALWAARGY